MVQLTVIEYRSFRRMASRHLSDEQIDGLVEYLAELPKSGDRCSSLKGLRAIDWPRKDLGGEPVATIGYYFSSQRNPLHLIGCFRLHEKDLGNKILDLAFHEFE